MLENTLLDQLSVGISLVTWYPQDPARMVWVFINDARCRMAGFTREEILSQPPIAQVSRESRALIPKVNEMLNAYGTFTVESTILDKANSAIPVNLHMTLVELEEGPGLLTEHHDLRSIKETEAQLERSQEGTLEMLALIDKGKQQLTKNFQGNLGLVLLPLIDQLKVTATAPQKEILDFMAGRINHIGQEIGVADPAGSFGANLTRRQILICEMIRDGLTSKELALALGCSPSTINNHRHTIRRKLKLAGKSANLQAYLNSSSRQDA